MARFDPHSLLLAEFVAPADKAIWAAVGIFAALVVLAVLALILKRKPGGAIEMLDQRIRLSDLGPTAPPSTGPRLELRRLPVRLALLVVAPMGRGNKLPADDAAALAEAVVPGLARCLTAHGTRVDLWPPQLSAQGFVQSFFGNAPLPGNRGQGSVWSAVAGKCESPGGPVLVGLLLSAASPNSFGQIYIEHKNEWIELLHVEETA